MREVTAINFEYRMGWDYSTKMRAPDRILYLIIDPDGWDWYKEIVSYEQLKEVLTSEEIDEIVKPYCEKHFLLLGG